jgi:hypothetical protein
MTARQVEGTASEAAAVEITDGRFENLECVDTGNLPVPAVPATGSD